MFFVVQLESAQDERRLLELHEVSAQTGGHLFKQFSSIIELRPALENCADRTPLPFVNIKPLVRVVMATKSSLCNPSTAMNSPSTIRTMQFRRSTMGFTMSPGSAVCDLKRAVRNWRSISSLSPSTFLSLPTHEGKQTEPSGA